LEGVTSGGYWGHEGSKGVFGRVLKFRGSGVPGEVQIVECGEARGDKIIDVQNGTGGSGRPQDMYA
jgi:hypothetical protein